MNVKTLICNCKGMDAFRYADMNSPPPEMESELDVSDILARAQICAEGGNQVLQDILRAAENDSDTYVVVCACQQGKQPKLFNQVLRRTDFETDRSVMLDMQNSANEGILDRICERLNEIAEKKPRN